MSNFFKKKYNKYYFTKFLTVEYGHGKPKKILLESTIIKKIEDYETEEAVQVLVTDKIANIRRKSTILPPNVKNDQQHEPLKDLSNQFHRFIKHNEQKIKTLQSKLDEETKKNQDSLKKITALSNELEYKDVVINKLEQQIEKLLSQLNEETRKYQVSMENFTSVNNELKNREEIIEELQNKLNDSREKITFLNNELRSKDDQINKLQQRDKELKKRIKAIIHQIQTKSTELKELINKIVKKHDLGKKGKLLVDNILEKQRNITLGDNNSAPKELEGIRKKLIEDYELPNEEIKDILNKRVEEIKLEIQLESMFQEESMISLNTKNDQSNEPTSKQQIIQKFKLNHGLFLDGYSIKPSKNAVCVEDGELNMSLYEGQPLVYTSINDRNSRINLLRFNSDDDNDVELNESLRSSDICINFPIAEITFTADLIKSFSNDDAVSLTLFETYGHLFSRKILIGGKLFIDDLKPDSPQIDMFKSLLTWVYDSAKYKKEFPFSYLTNIKFFPKVTTLEEEKLDTLSKLVSWMNNLYQKNMASIISYNNLVRVSELRFGTTSLLVNEIQPGVANYKDESSLKEWVKDSIYVDLTRWVKEFRLFQGLIINQHFELENSKNIAVKFINIPNVNSSDKLYLEMIKPITTLEEFLRSNNVNKFLDKELTLLPFIKRSVKSVNLSYENYTHFIIKCERYKILFSEADIKPSEEFEQAIEKALESMKPYTILQDVFDKYGYFFPLNITLGNSFKNILTNSSLSFTFKKMETLFESLKPFLDNFNVSYFLTKKGNIIKKEDLHKWIQSTNDMEIIEFDNIISLYDILKEEQQRDINIILNTQNDAKIIMTGIDDLTDLIDNNTEHYKRINIDPSFDIGNGKYEVFGSIISKDKKQNLKSDFFVRFGLYNINGFSAMIKTLNKNNEINITECYILWIIIGIPSELLVFSPRNRELPVNCIKDSITLRHDNSDTDYSIKISHQLSQGDIISINVYCPTTNYDPINVKLIGWSKNHIIFQILKPIYTDSNLNNSGSSIVCSKTIIEEVIVIDMHLHLCILSSEYECLKIDKIDNEEKGGEHSCRLNLLGYTLTEKNFK
jgi:hypothetical protein